MKLRMNLYITCSLVVAVMLVAFATYLQISPITRSTDLSSLPRLHLQTPSLLIVDIACAYLIFFTICASLQVRQAQEQVQAHARLAAEQMRIQEDHDRQVESLMERNDQMERQNIEQEEVSNGLRAMIARLEEQVDTRQDSFETEARRLTEQAFRAFQSQLEANTRQLDAVNMAMQYQRTEIKQLRHRLDVLQGGSEVTSIARLTPAEIAAIESAASAAQMTPEANIAAKPGEDSASNETDYSMLAVTERRENGWMQPASSHAGNSANGAESTNGSFVQAARPTSTPSFVGFKFGSPSARTETPSVVLPSLEEQANAVPEVTPDDFEASRSVASPEQEEETETSENDETVSQHQAAETYAASSSDWHVKL